MTAPELLHGTATVRLADVIADDLDTFLDRTAELAFGPEDSSVARSVPGVRVAGGAHLEGQGERGGAQRAAGPPVRAVLAIGQRDGRLRFAPRRSG